MDYTTSVGRFVQGDCFKGQSKDNKGQPYVIKTGPNKGQTTTRYFISVAYPKLVNGQPNNEFNKFFRDVIDAARAGYPAMFTGPLDPFTGKPGCTHPRMTYKIMDGDGVDANGKDNKTKEGFAGHWVVKFNSQFPFRCYNFGAYAPEQQLQDPMSIQLGDYVSVSGSCEANIGSDVPGVYMNGNLICKVAPGPRIVNGPDAGAAFGNLNVAGLPAGVAPGTAPSGAAPAQPAVAYQPPAPPVQPGGAQPTAYQPQYAAVPQPPITPNAGFVQGAMAPPPPPPAMPVPPPMPAAGPVLTAAGVQAGGTYDNFRANGWTDDGMRQAGYLV